MNRISKQNLEASVSHLNSMLGQPAESYTRDDEGKYRGNPGNYHLDWAYGGVQLVQMSNTGGGIRTVSRRGTKRECYDTVWAILELLYGEHKRLELSKFDNRGK